MAGVSTKRCKRIGPLSGLRCMLKAGHDGPHKNDPKQAKALARAFVDMMIPKSEPQKKEGRK